MKGALTCYLNYNHGAVTSDCTSTANPSSSPDRPVRSENSEQTSTATEMLAYISMHPVDWNQHSYVALCSVSEKALMHQLDTHPLLNRIVLCLDNDRAGQEAVDRIKNSLLEKGYTDIRVQIPLNKDWDDDLQEITRTNSQRQKEGSQWTESEHSSLSLS